MSKNWKKILLSEILIDSKLTRRIAYIAIMAAFTVGCNLFEIKFADIQFSLTIFISAMTGIIIGPLFGFVASFVGDLVGFLCNSGGFPYMPWIGITMGLVALISGLIVNGINFKFKGAIFLKLALVSVLTFLICTVAINTTIFWTLYAPGVPYFTYLASRLFISGQIWNSLLNYALLFAFYPLIIKIRQIISKNKGHGTSASQTSVTEQVETVDTGITEIKAGTEEKTEN